jgi:adenylate cyclase, class 2
MNQELIETEVKLYMADLAIVEKKLQELGAMLVKPRVFERNVRYEDAEKTLTGRDIVVRLRKDAKIRLTYKEPVNIPDQDGIRSRFEAEVEVSDYETMAVILQRLGYLPHLSYEKWRTTYTWDDVEVVLDEMPYGNFVEIEGRADEIRKAITALGLQDVPRYSVSYQVLFDRVKQRLGLDFQDLTFENFAGVVVAEQAFGDFD